MKRFKFILFSLVVLNLLVGGNIFAKDKEAEILTLDEIVVTASKYKEKLSEAAVSVEVIDEEEIKQKNAHNVADLLRNMAGINFTDYGGPAGQKTIRVRGADTEQVLILIDGQPMNSSQNGSVDLSQFSIEQIERIEVLRGPASALYGANALGGVINIITKSGSQSPETRMKVSYGSFNTQDYKLIHRGESDKLAYNISLAKKKSDGHRENSELDQENIFAKFNYDLNKYSDLLFSLQYTDSAKGSPGPISSRTPNAQQDDEDMNINLQWNQQTENSDSKIALYYNEHQNIYDNPDKWGYDGPSEHNTERLALDFNRIKYYDAHTLSYGGEVVENRIDSTENGEHNDLSKAIFIQDEWRLIDDLKLTLGSRYDNHESFGGETSSRIGAVYTINSKLNLHVSVGEAYRTPTYNDLYWPADDYTEGNPDLEPETALAYETGLRYLDNNFKGELNLFKRDVNDLINWAPGNDGIYRPSNINTAKVSGLELILTKYLTDNLATDFNYTYLDARDKKTDQRLDYRNYHSLNLGLNYSGKQISGSLNSQLVAGRAEELPSYFVVDAKLNNKIKENLELSLGINNLFDREYQVNKGYPMLERNYMLTVSKKF
ncbi:TonB-dependent receptor plug domain-containing protein [Orenia marismortui]|uniref:Outer membrane receptor for ferrienterochelin and colicins n=1 Tax=Orenia marismortui TaxID=46469 RepID=A0A4R8H0R8_9FIRM|nr:TonB-dependent receptor [Orenia marismortui]TDX52998.1 outer membrane receptor for ferrienterochelin and colicins [Orenia marismortui]